ncbi:hypothetical protein D3C74_423220 [compost metagenome]
MVGSCSQRVCRPSATAVMTRPSEAVSTSVGYCPASLPSSTSPVNIACMPARRSAKKAWAGCAWSLASALRRVYSSTSPGTSALCRMTCRNTRKGSSLDSVR